MTVKEFWHSKEKLAIHCSTEEQANLLLKKFNELGRFWRDGESYLSNNCFDCFKESTCYNNERGYSSTNGIYIKINHVHIIEFTDLEDFKSAPVEQYIIDCISNQNYFIIKHEDGSQFFTVSKRGNTLDTVKRIIGIIHVKEVIE